MGLGSRTEWGGEWAFSVLLRPLLSGFPLPTFHSRADRPSGDTGAEWDDVGACGHWAGVPGRAGQAGLGHLAGCTGGSGLEVPCCQRLSLIVIG